MGVAVAVAMVAAVVVAVAVAIDIAAADGTASDLKGMTLRGSEFKTSRVFSPALYGFLRR